MQATQANDSAAKRRARRTLALLALICVAPVLASYVAYYWLRPDARTNYGQLLDAMHAPEIAGARLDGSQFRLPELEGRWVLIVAEPGACDAGCVRRLYATRQARTMQNREQDRVARLLLLPEGAPAPGPDLLTAQPGLIVVRGNPRQWSALPGATQGAVSIVDPHGNLVLAYPPSPDIRGLAKDLERLLRASRIG
jgi:hypothetical protein